MKGAHTSAPNYLVAEIRYYNHATSRVGGTLLRRDSLNLAVLSSLPAGVQKAKNVLLEWDNSRTAQTHVLPENFRDWDLIRAWGSAGTNEYGDLIIPTSALANSGDTQSIGQSDVSVILRYTPSTRTFRMIGVSISNLALRYLSLED